MKRCVICAVFVVAMAAFCVGLGACNSTNVEQAIVAQVCETRNNFFCGKSGDVVATFTDGLREEPFKMDGTKSKMVGYGVLVVKGLSSSNNPQTFELDVDGKKFFGELEKNPIDGTLVFDIETQVGKDAKVTLKLAGISEKIELENLSKNWACNQTKAISAFVKAQKPVLAANIANGVFEGEIFVKIVGEDSSQNVYYYILCVTKRGEVHSALVDVETCEIVQF